MNNKLLSIIAVFIGILLPMKVSAQMGDYISTPKFTFEGDNLVMTCETQGASIYYVMSEYADDDEAYSLVENLDISEANSMRTLYTAPFPVTKNVVIKAIAKMPQQQEESEVKTIIYSYTAWSELLEAINYGSDVLARAQDNPNVSDDLKENLQWAIEDGEHFYYHERGMMPDSYEAVMIRQHILEIAHEIEEILGPAQTVPEPYAVLSQNNTVLTFYYDENKKQRNGMDVGSFNRNAVRWNGQQQVITSVVFDTSFANCTTLKSTAYWFSGCSNLTTITGINNLKTNNVTNMEHMFENCYALTSLDLSGLQTDNVTDMKWMFRHCSELKSLNLSGFKTDNVTDMEKMFDRCFALTNLDVSGFKTHNVTNMSYMFYECSSLTSLDLNEFKTDNVKDMGYMFWGCSNLKSLNVSGFNTGNVTNMHCMFAVCSSLTSLDLSRFITDNVEDMCAMFGGCSGLTSLDLSGFKTNNLKDISGLFENCLSLTSLDLNGFKTDNVTNMESMFKNCSALTKLDLNGFNTENVTDISDMFYGCSGLTSIDLSNFNTANMTDMGYMFDGCSGLTNIDLSNFNTANVTAMGHMFDGCSGLTSIDLSAYNTYNVTDMNSMFRDCSGLTCIYTGDKWNTAKITYDISGTQMFTGCTSLVGGAGTHYDANHTDYTYAHIDGGTANPGYFTASGAEPWKDIDTVVLTGKNANFWYESTGTNPGGEEAIIFTIPEIPEEGMEWEFNILGTFIQNQLAFTTVDGEAVDNIIGDILFETKGNMVAIQDGRMLIYESDNERGEIAMVDPYSGMIRIMGNEITLRLLNDPNSKFMALPLCVKANYNNRDVAVKNGSFTVLVQSPRQVQEAEPYAVLSNNNTVLTFYYDDQKESRNGMSVGPFFGFINDNDNWSVSSSWYENRERITNVVFDTSFANCFTLTSTAYWFYGLKNLTSITGISNLNTDNVTDMYGMFGECSSLTSLNVSRFKTDNVTDMERMFMGCSGLTSLDVTNFNTENVTSLGEMFEGCSGLMSLDVSRFKTDKVWDMSGMFYNCSGLTSLDLSGFNTENVTYIAFMFYGCSSLTTLDLSRFKTDNVDTYMNSMFYNCSSLMTLDLSGFKTDNVTNMDAMFYGCSSLINIDISNFNTSKVTQIGSIFANCSSLAAIQAGSANIPAEEYARIGNPNLLVYVNEASLAPQGVQNVVVNGVAQEIILTDVTEGNNNWNCPQAFTAEKISYTRNFKQQTEVGISRGWESIALPFTVQTITHETQGQIIPFGAQGTGKYFWLRGYSPEGLHRATVLEANTPYVISMPNNPTVYYAEYNLNGRVTFEAKYTTVPATPNMRDMVVTRGNITMAPIFVTVPRDEAVYAINVSQPLDRYAEGSVFARELREVRPFEAATTHEPVNGARPNYIRIAPQPDYDVTGIVSVENGEWGMENGEWFGLDGRKLSGEPKTKGVYIQNGKKRIVK